MKSEVLLSDTVQQSLEKQAHRKEVISRFLPYMGLSSIFVFFLIVTKGAIINEMNRINLINQSFTLTVVAMGGAFVFAHGGADMSVAATCGCAQLAASLLLTQLGMPLWVCFLAALAITIIGASLTASLGIVLGVPVFVGSLCIRSVFNGILATGTEQSKVFVSQASYGFMNETAVKAVILIALFAVGYYLFEHTGFGRKQKAIGGNDKTATQAGINLKKQKLLAYVILGICVGIAAIFQMFRNGEVTSQSGSGLEFNMMLAVLLGGLPMLGGEKARFTAAVIGALTLTVLENGLILWGLDISIVNGVKGILFVFIIGISYDKSQGKLVT